MCKEGSSSSKRSNREKRIMQEIKHIRNNPSEMFSAGPEEEEGNSSNLYKWQAKIFGPANSDYSGGVFKLKIEIPEGYPFVPPKICFTTKVYHPNIDSEGNICVDILKKDRWSPVQTISSLLISILSMLSDPNPDDPLVPDISITYNNNRELYKRTAREWTDRYAKP